MKLVLLGVDRILLVGCCCLLLPGGGAAAAAAATSSPARERISRYVEEGQMFMIQHADEVTILLENPNTPITPGGNVKWLCTPNHAPDNNGDGVHDSVVGHMLLYRPPKEVEDLQQQGADVKGSWNVGGFTSAWANDHYKEYMVSYSNQLIGQLTEIIMDDNTEDADNTTNAASSWFSSVVWMEPSTSTEISGLTASTEVEWTFNATSDPKLVEMAEDLGKELTGTTCEEKYAEVWSALKKNTSSSSTSTSSSSSTLAIMIITTVSSLYSLW